MRVVLVGPPGCGKGTQGDLMGKELAIPHISSGDLLREVACHFDIQRVAVNAAACCRLRTRIRLAGGYRRRKPRPGTSQ